MIYWKAQYQFYLMNEKVSSAMMNNLSYQTLKTEKYLLLGPVDHQDQTDICILPCLQKRGTVLRLASLNNIAAYKLDVICHRKEKNDFADIAVLSDTDVGDFDIHHIDENSSNHCISNLLPVCTTCHSKINKGDI